MKTIRRIAANPLTYVLGFSVLGACGVVAGVALLAGLGWALVIAGAFALAASAFVAKGMSPNV